MIANWLPLWPMRVPFPKCLCLIDTYDTLASGLLNFCYMALGDFGYAPKEESVILETRQPRVLPIKKSCSDWQRRKMIILEI
jgi:hypothetical protein